MLLRYRLDECLLLYHCCGVAYDEIFSLLHDSSLLENYCIIRTAFYACGLSDLSVQSSHFCMAPVFEGIIAP